MTKKLKRVITALTMCGVLSAYAACYSLRSERCVVPGSYVGNKTYLPGEPCYDCCSSQHPRVYASSSESEIDPVDRCEILWPGYPEIPYTHTFSSCGAT